MYMILRIIITAFVAMIGVGSVSIVWPRITSVRRPAPLQNLYNVITSTEVGRQVEDVLGAHTPEASGSANIGTIVGSMVSGIGTTIAKRVEQNVTEQAIEQLTHKFETLPPEQKAKIQDAICTPQSVSP